MSILVSDEWMEATPGSFILVLGAVTHDFDNRSDTRAGILDLSLPEPFESNMPAIVE